MRITKQDVIWNYVGVVFAIGSNIFILPIIINYLDSDSLGLWYVFLSAGSFVSLVDFGFSPSFTRNIAYAWSGAPKLVEKGVSNDASGGPNLKLLEILFVSCKTVYLLLALIATLILVSIGTIYVVRITKSNLTISIIAWIAYSFSVFFNLYFGFNTPVLRGTGQIANSNKAVVISSVLYLLLSFLLLKTGFKLFGMAISYLIKALSYNVFSLIYLKKNNILNNIIKPKQKVETDKIVDIIRTIWPNTWRDGLVSLSNFFSNQAAVLLCPIYLSLAETALFSISIQIATAISVLSGTLYNAFQPSMQMAYVNKKDDMLKRLVSLSMTIYVLCFCIGVLVLVIFGIPILRIIKPDMILDINVILLTCIYVFLLKNHSYYASYISNTNEIKYLKPFLISSVLGLALSYILLKHTCLGVFALIIGQALIQIAFNNWYWPRTVHKSLKINYLTMFKLSCKEMVGYFKINR